MKNPADGDPLVFFFQIRQTREKFLRISMRFQLFTGEIFGDVELLIISGTSKLVEITPSVPSPGDIYSRNNYYKIGLEMRYFYRNYISILT